jgi:hypothetical protein
VHQRRFVNDLGVGILAVNCKGKRVQGGAVRTLQHPLNAFERRRPGGQFRLDDRLAAERREKGLHAHHEDCLCHGFGAGQRPRRTALGDMRQQLRGHERIRQHQWNELADRHVVLQRLQRRQGPRGARQDRYRRFGKVRSPGPQRRGSDSQHIRSIGIERDVFRPCRLLE